jgi:hypothetical protein
MWLLIIEGSAIGYGAIDPMGDRSMADPSMNNSQLATMEAL